MSGRSTIAGLAFFVLLLPFFSGAQNSADKTNVKISIFPRQTEGEPVTVTFQVESASATAQDFYVTSMPSDANWRVVGPQQIRNTEVVYSNGQTTQRSTVSLIFQAIPLKTGRMRLPKISIKVGTNNYSCDDASIYVKSLQGSQAPTQTAKPGTRIPIFPMDQDDAAPVPHLGQAGNQQRPLEVFVVAEPSKTDVFQGELITLPFYVYTNENIFRNLEFGSFPTFKDFLKEELYLPKNWRPERVQYRNSNYFRTEVIRFALFPIKTGELLIDPLKMRFEVDTDMFQLFEQFLNGQGIANGQQSSPQTFLRSSGSIPINVKPLPPKPATVAQEVIPVGQYQISMQPPKQTLVQSEPFTLRVRVEGRGNIKGIPEPDIKLPQALRRSKVSTNYEFSDNAEGFKDFDMLVVPEAAGKISIPENEWTYFDPDKKTYETLHMPSVELRIDPSGRKTITGPVASESTVVYSGEQDFTDRDSRPISPWLWALPTALYASAGFLFVQRRRREQEDAMQLNEPWLIIEKKFRALKDQNSSEGLRLLEEWILSRFGSLAAGEPSFGDLIEKLLRICPASVHAKIQKLRERFRHLEAVRFGKVRSGAEFALSFDEIKKISEEIIYSSASAPVEPSDDADF